MPDAQTLDALDGLIIAGTSAGLLVFNDVTGRAPASASISTATGASASSGVYGAQVSPWLIIAAIAVGVVILVKA